jgi:hypothetical protein
MPLSFREFVTPETDTFTRGFLSSTKKRSSVLKKLLLDRLVVQNKAKTLQKPGFQPVNEAQKGARRSFSTRCAPFWYWCPENLPSPTAPVRFCFETNLSTKVPPFVVHLGGIYSAKISRGK